MSYKEEFKKIEAFYKTIKTETNSFNIQKPFYYVVPMFPYPSGNIHMGHIRNYALSNTIKQYYKSKGVDVFHPIGFDSFGQPAEDAAIKHKVNPSAWTENNIKTMLHDFEQMNFDFDYTNTICTHEFKNYKFEQDIFKKAFAAGIIYKRNQYVNYDPISKTVLSNEQCKDGIAWRSGAKVIRKKMPMYFFNMRNYAHRLIDGLSEIGSDWPAAVVNMQKKWIGIKYGKTISFTHDLNIFKDSDISEIKSVIMGINHPYVKQFESDNQFKTWFSEASQTTVSDKDNFNKINYFNTGSGVEYNNEVYPILIDINKDDEAAFNKFNSTVVPTKIESYIKEVDDESIGLKDWCISRQRYWGNPIPMIECDDCGDVPSIEHVRLPTTLIPTGEGNCLDKDAEFNKCTCPNCGKDATRCTDTMDTFVQSAWYYHRYLSANSEKMIAKPDAQIDFYIGGIEHATMHLIYTRFFHKMLKDLGYVTTEEPIKKLVTQGMVCKKYTKPDGTIASAKMSKSLGNTVAPFEYVDAYGSDALSMFMIFAAPPNQNFDFTDTGIVGTYRFIDDVYRHFFEPATNIEKIKNQNEVITQVNKMESYIDREFTTRFNLNTIIPQLMTTFKLIKKCEFEDLDIKANIEQRFIKQFSIFAPCLGTYVQHFCLTPKIESNAFNI